jgi:hypothetical protein
MTGAALLPLGVRKEIRALLPVWLACVAAMAGAAMLWESGGHRGRTLAAVPILAYVLGSVALGALSMGHEYTGRTLTLLLSLPADRRRLYLVKLGVLITMLLTLGALAYSLVVALAFDREGINPTTIPLFSGMCALFLAPWLTMICRSALAGVVFALAIPGLVHIAGDVAGATAHGFGPDAERLKLAVFWWGLSGFCVVAAVSSWRMFMRLEAIERRDPQMPLPRWLRGAAAAAETPDVERVRHPVWLLAKKELRLQHLTLVVSGIYLLAWGALALGRQIAPMFEDNIEVLTVIHGGAAALLSGSLASAEERHFGTLESQLLLPMATWKQWAVKAGITLGLALLLGAGLPALLGNLDPSARPVRFNAPFAGITVLLTAASLYVSSLCASGLRAVVTSLSAIVVGLLAVRFVVDFFPRAFASSVATVLTATQHEMLRSWTEPLLALAGAGFVSLLLWFGLMNHRSAERSGRVWRQVGCMASVAAVLLLLMR